MVTLDCGKHRGDLLRIADVTPIGVGHTALRTYLRRHRLARFELAARHDHVRTMTRQQLRCGCADPAAAAAYERYLAGQVE